MSIRRVCVFCASSERCDPYFHGLASRLGAMLAAEGLGVVYGGGSTGLMGRLADGVLAGGGKVVGVLPRFMDAVEWGHTGLSEMHLVDDLHERVKRMKELSDAFIALPGGCGTLDELFQALTWKRLGLHVGPIIIVNARGYYDACIAQLRACVDERFMDQAHLRMWTVVPDVDGVIEALHNAPEWSSGAMRFARPGTEGTSTPADPTA